MGGWTITYIYIYMNYRIISLLKSFKVSNLYRNITYVNKQKKIVANFIFYNNFILFNIKHEVKKSWLKKINIYILFAFFQ